MEKFFESCCLLRLVIANPRQNKELHMDEEKKFEARNLWLYFLIAFGWSWLLWLPGVIITITDNRALMYWMSSGDVQMTLPVWF